MVAVMVAVEFGMIGKKTVNKGWEIK